MLRVKRLPQEMDMIAAGTNAPIPMAAKASPANHGEKEWRNSAGIAKLLPKIRYPSAYSGIPLTPTATAITPRSAMRASAKVKLGSRKALRLSTLRLDDENTPVIECG